MIHKRRRLVKMKLFKILRRSEYSWSRSWRGCSHSFHLIPLVVIKGQLWCSSKNINWISFPRRNCNERPWAYSWANYGTNIITFNEDELTQEGTRHIKSLHITLECWGMIISRVIIANRSALNVFLAMTLSMIGIEDLPKRNDGACLMAPKHQSAVI